MDLPNILRHTGVPEERLNARISDNHLGRIFLLDIEWRRLVTPLELNGLISLQNIEHDHHTEQMRKEAFITRWRQIRDFNATYRVLVNALLMIMDATHARMIVELLRGKLAIST